MVSQKMVPNISTTFGPGWRLPRSHALWGMAALEFNDKALASAGRARLA